MNFQQMNLAVFSGQHLPHVFFQPRFEPWYWWHKEFNCMPRRYEGMSLLDLYDYCHASTRTIHYYNDNPDPIVCEVDPSVKQIVHHTDTQRLTRYQTPYGELVTEFEYTVDHTWREVQFPIKTPDDLEAFTWLMERTRYRFDRAKFDVGAKWMGERGAPQFWVPKSPYQALLQFWWTMEDVVYAMADCPEKVERAMEAIDLSYDTLYEELCGAGCLKIINYGENLHEQLICPDYFERYYLPFYEKRCGQLRAAGIYTHVHVDGYFKHMLPWLKKFPHDGIEALTPLPQGDMMLEEIREHIGDKVLLDGIPAVLFMEEHYTRDQLMECVEKVVELFHPRLVLGVSDEVPQGAGEEAIERVKMIGEWAQRKL